MCGIAALFSQKPLPLLSLVQAMSQTVRHRGPDDEGYLLVSGEGAAVSLYGGPDTPQEVYTRGHAYSPKLPTNAPSPLSLGALGHRRLSIVDLSPAGHQPMCSSDQRFWITYNGEVYNHLEIRQELEQLGYSFQSHTDTEVILNAFQEWGKDCLHHFNGMFAFVIFDAKEKKVFAARDRFGVKPFYYWISPDGIIAFASEIKQFTVLPGWEAVLNGQRAYDYLNWGITDHTNETLFSSVFHLRGGEYLEYTLRADPRSLQIQKWYHLHLKPFQGTFSEACDHFQHLMEDSVRLRLRADVDIGSCLSGGLDSSTIVCLANKLLRQKNAAQRQKTFSSCCAIKKFDERHFIDLVVEETGVDAHYLYPSLGDFLDSVGDITWHQDEPFVSSSIYAQWMIFKTVKQNGVKVMLDGQGSDEIMAGYSGFFSHRFFDLFQAKRWSQLVKELIQTKQAQGGSLALSHYLSWTCPQALRHPLRRLLGKTATAPHWLDIHVLEAHDCDPFEADRRGTIAQQSYVQLTRSCLPMLLRYEDRNSMAHSIESRTPFLDYRLVEFVYGLPSDHKLFEGTTKRILRESMKGILPEPIRTRKDKMAFVTAEEEWIKKQHSSLFRDRLYQAVEQSQGVIKPSALQIGDDIISGKRPFTHYIWRMIGFSEWMNKFSVVNGEKQSARGLTQSKRSCVI